MLILQGFLPLGDVKHGWDGKTSYFEAKCVNLENCRRYIQRYC